ncbi:unnamed protein product [Owenia fusiformis]|uniref:Uncharacterized protein n=1 Tax=Owenia fusiformis TaxID=6347 RepID=A0A8S4QBT2_OWEFU|nr:unnamed protein product [Owenia fusiformis]
MGIKELFQPTLYTAVKRRWWLLVTNVIELLLFSALMFGWSALMLTLKEEGFYSELCTDSAENSTSLNSTLGNITIVPEIEIVDPTSGNFSYLINQSDSSSRRLLSAPPPGVSSSGIGCSAQDQMLNLVFTVGNSLMSVATFPIGLLQDRFGYRIMRLIGSVLFSASCVVMSFANQSFSWILFPALAINGIGGIMVTFTSLQIPNLFGHMRATMLGLLIGAYSSAAVVFPGIKILYDMGVPISVMWLTLATGGGWMFFNTIFNVPRQIIPAPELLPSLSELRRLHNNRGKLYEEVSQKEMARIGHRLSKGDEAMEENGNHGNGTTLRTGEGTGYFMSTSTSNLNINKAGLDETKENKEDKPEPFKEVIKHPIFIWGLVLLSIAQLRILLYIGAMEIELLKASGGDPEAVNSYSKIFGLIQIMCFAFCPAIGIVIDWGTKKYINDTTVTKEEREINLKLQKLRNIRNAFLLTNILLVLFGVTVLIPNLQIQIVTFILHTAVRGFGFSAVCALYALVFHFANYGKVIGAQTLVAALVDLLQSPMFILIEGVSGRNPLYVNIGLLIVSFLTFGLPVYVHMLQKRYTDSMREEADLDKQNGNTKYAITSGH